MDDEENIFEKLQNGEERLPESDRLMYEADLLINAPEITLDSWIAAGFKQFIIHLESTDDMGGIISRLRSAGVGVGIAFKPSTSNDKLAPYINAIDFVQCMGNDLVGQAGVPLDPLVLDKIRDLRKKFPDLPLGVDIGVSTETAPELIAAGATRLAAGSAIFKSEDPERAIRKLAGES